MKKKVTMLMLFLIILTMNTACQKSISKNDNTTTENQAKLESEETDNKTKETNNTNKSQPLTAKKRESNDNNAIDSSIAISSFIEVMKNEKTFFSTDDKNDIYMKDFHNFCGIINQNPTFSKFCMIDLDQDTIPEIVLYVAIGTETVGTEVLHFNQGKVYGYSFNTRTMQKLKTDGTFIYSDSAVSNGIGKIHFENEKLYIDSLTDDNQSQKEDIVFQEYTKDDLVQYLENYLNN